MLLRALVLLLALAGGVPNPGAFAATAQPTVDVVEYYHAGLDHYFMTGSAFEQAMLDNGAQTGWRRTGLSFLAFAPNAIQAGARPVCRYYGLPGAGINSHFYSAIPQECATLGTLRARDWMLESSNVFQVMLPDTVTGACLADAVPVYRLYNQRPDVNHRYTTEPSVREQMKAQRYVAEGYGPDGVAFCAQPKAATPPSGAPAQVEVTIDAVRVDAERFAFAAIIMAPNPIATYAWDLGDGTTSTAATITHRYATAGRYTVRLTATDDQGNRGTASTEVTVTLAPAPTPPVATIVATPTASDTFSFNSSVTTAAGASVTSHAWSFGDGASATGATATHKYAASGTYTVTLTVKDSNNLSATATASVDAVVATAPPPTPPPPPVLPPAGVLGDRVRTSLANTSYMYASNPLGESAPWRKYGGDWLDRNGVHNGPAPTISHVVTSANVTIDISGIDGDLLLQGLDGWDQPKIDGLDVEAFWTDRTSNRAIPPPTKSGNPGIVINTTRGRTLTLTANVHSIGATLRIDRVAGPVIDDRPTYVGPSNRPDLLDLDLTSEVALLAVLGSGYANQYAFNPEFKVDPQTGLKYLRFSSDVAFQKLIAWFINFPGRESAHARYLLYIEDDVADGMTELGMKLPGLTNHTGELISWRMEHGRVDPRNRGSYSFVDYLYNAESGSGYGLVRSMGGTVLRAGRWYSIEQRMVLNTPGVGDGYGEIWLNGHSVWKSSTVRWRDQPATKITQLHVNVYHGGMGLPSRPFHYRIAKIGLGSSYIGVPNELLAAAAPPVTTPNTSYPAWRAGMTKDRVAAIANTANMGGVTSQGNGTRQGYNTIDAWNGLAAGPTTWWAAANGGHDQGNGILWENKVYKIDLAAAAPRWTLVHPGSPWSQVTPNGHHYLDGLPVSRHTYYTAQFLPSKNRVMLFGAAAPYAIGFAPPAFQGGTIVDGFDVQSGKWDSVYTWATAPADLFHMAWGVARDPRSDEVYVTGNHRFAKWSPLANAWTRITPKNPDLTNTTAPSGEFKPTLIDVKRNRWVFYSGNEIRTIDLASHVFTRRGAVTGAITTGADDYSALVHDLDNDRYLTVQGTGLYAIHPDTLVSTLLATVPKSVNGTQNRLAYFPDLGGVAYLPSYSSDVLFMPTR